MKTLFIHLISFALLSNGAVLNAQGTFQDLNFEEANLTPIAGSPYYPYAVTVANALPGWTVDYGDVQQTQILYNNPSTGSTAVTLLANGYGPPIDGNFSVLLQGGVVSGTPTAASISQTGMIPATAEYLTFEVGMNYGGSGTLDVSIGAQNIPLLALGTGPNYSLYGGNIPAWEDNQSEQLTISAPGLSGNWEIDDIYFSTNVVASPEPSMVALSAMGGLLFGARKWFARRS
ncbi:MAG: hypothetical protein ABSA83_23670 [Verrucomicrobiota bacterium]|jgi:hypothetical protein